MTDGAHTPRIQTRPDQSANLTDHTAGSEPAPAKPCQPPVTSRQIGPLAQAERRPGELMRLGLEGSGTRALGFSRSAEKVPEIALELLKNKA